MHIKVEYISDSDLQGLEVLVRMDITGIVRVEHHKYPEQDKEPVNVPNFPPEVHKILQLRTKKGYIDVTIRQFFRQYNY